MALEQQVDCFRWQNLSSDYLDGTLPEPLQRAADDHLDSCKSCNERHKHFRLVLSTIAAQPRATLPDALKKAPLTRVLPHKGQASELLHARWEQIPWFLRTLFEGVGILVIILIGITTGPKIRSIYEKNLEKNLNEFQESSLIAEPNSDSMEPILSPGLEKKEIPSSSPSMSAGSSKASLGSSTRSSMDSSMEPGDELAGEDDLETPSKGLATDAATGSSDQTAGIKNPIHAGRSELWRFTLKTVSPDELRPQIVKALTNIGIAPTTQGLNGSQVPGGIEFDMILPQSSVPKIKQALEKLVPTQMTDESKVNSGKELFTWYKVKSKRKLPNGTSQVVIWLSQPN